MVPVISRTMHKGFITSHKPSASRKLTCRGKTERRPPAGRGPHEGVTHRSVLSQDLGGQSQRRHPLWKGSSPPPSHLEVEGDTCGQGQARHPQATPRLKHEKMKHQPMPPECQARLPRVPAGPGCWSWWRAEASEQMPTPRGLPASGVHAEARPRGEAEPLRQGGFWV